MSNPYTPGWRTGDAGGAVNWSDAWTAGQYAQQIKGAGGVDDEYSARFDTLQKSDSSVDNEEGWRTVTSLRNNESANVQSIQKQAAEWKAKGFDVRVQDLDESHGAEWADLAVRKGSGKDEVVAEPQIEQTPAVDSEHLAKAKERVQTWEQGVETGQSSHEIFGQNPTDYDFTNNQFTRYDKPNPFTQSNKATELLDTYKTGFSTVSSAADSNNANALAVALPNTAGSAQPIADFSSVKNEEEDPYSWQTQVGMR